MRAATSLRLAQKSRINEPTGPLYGHMITISSLQVAATVRCALAKRTGSAENLGQSRLEISHLGSLKQRDLQHHKIQTPVAGLRPERSSAKPEPFTVHTRMCSTFLFTPARLLWYTSKSHTAAIYRCPY